MKYKFNSKMLIPVVAVFISNCTILNNISANTTQSQEPSYTASIDHNKKVTVVPFNGYLDQVDAASIVEKELLKYNFNIEFYSDSPVDVETKKDVHFSGISPTSNDGNPTVSGQDIAGTEIERYSVTKTDADIIFFTAIKDDNISIKVVRKSDEKVIGIAIIDKYNVDYELAPFLLKIGLISEIEPQKI